MRGNVAALRPGQNTTRVFVFGASGGLKTAEGRAMVHVSSVNNACGWFLICFSLFLVRFGCLFEEFLNSLPFS